MITKKLIEFKMQETYKIIVPPIKCQGIKTKIVKSIKENLQWDRKGKWSVFWKTNMPKLNRVD